MRQSSVTVAPKSSCSIEGVCTILSRYPMYVLPVCLVLEIAELLPHEERLKDGTLKAFVEGMLALFVSHQWTGNRHPDPTMKQFRVLQQCLRNMISGSCKPETHWITALFFQRQGSISAKECRAFADAYVWYDYFSVPQADSEKQADSIRSIPQYVSKAAYFLVLCPATQHEGGHVCDFISWAARGWCRLEETSRRLSRFNELVIVVTGENQAYLYESQDYMFHPVGSGDFSCCRLGHVIDGKEIPCDKYVLRPTVRELVRSCMVINESRSPFHHNFLGSIAGTLLSGLESDPRRQSLSLPPALDADEVGLTPRARRREHGWGPLMFATLRQDVGSMVDLVRQGAPVDLRTTGKPEGVLLHKGSTALMAAAYFTPTGGAVQCLIQLRANCDLANSAGKDAMSLAALAGHTANIEVLLAGGANLRHGDSIRSSALLGAASMARYAAVRELLEGRADPRFCNIFGAMPLHGAAQSGDARSVALLVDSGTDKDQRHIPQTVAAAAGYRVVRMVLACGKEDQVLENIVNAWEGTPLMSAALQGQLGCIEELLRRGADTSLRNRLGKTARDLAQMRGDQEAVARLSQPPPEP